MEEGGCAGGFPGVGVFDIFLTEITSVHLKILEQYTSEALILCDVYNTALTVRLMVMNPVYVM